jgi:formamidopyrimidine-DNA glycosylase
MLNVNLNELFYTPDQQELDRFAARQLEAKRKLHKKAIAAGRTLYVGDGPHYNIYRLAQNATSSYTPDKQACEHCGRTTGYTVKRRGRIAHWCGC